VAVGGVIHYTFRKDKDGVAAVGGFAGEAEALADAGKFWERKNVEERGKQEIPELIGPVFCEKPFAGRSTHAHERFSSHCGGQAMTKTPGECSKDQADVGAAGDVVGDDDGRAFEILQVMAADDARVGEDLGGRPD